MNKIKQNIVFSTIDDKAGGYHLPCILKGGNRLCGYIGPSMNPTLNDQDLLEIKSYDQAKRNPRVGDVILFKPPQFNQLMVHRIFRIIHGGIIARGDNNNDIDPWILQEKHIIGQVIAAQQGEKSRNIAGGFIGRLIGLSCYMRRKVIWLATKVLRPLYLSFSTGGLLHWLIPLRLNPLVTTYRSGANASHKLLLGKLVIGSFNESSLQWQIKCPYRVIIDESSLPSPR